MKIAVGGQMDKKAIAELIKTHGGDAVEVSVMGDLEAAMGVQGGSYDYYVGACATGAGAALAMAIGMLGGDRCVSLSIPGNIKDADQIKEEVQSNKVAFGFVNTDSERIIPALVKALIEKGEKV